MVISDPVDVGGVGDRAALVSNNQQTTLFVQKGQYMITVLAFAPVAAPSADAMVPIAARVLPAL